MKTSVRSTFLALREDIPISRSVMRGRDAITVAVEHEGEHGYGETVTSRYMKLPKERILRLLEPVGPQLACYPDPETALEAWKPRDLPPAVAAGVESALLDLVGRRAGVSLHTLLGSPIAPAAATARTIGIVSPAQAADQAEEYALAGFSMLKVKVGAADPAEDRKRVAAVRKRVPHTRLLLDVNGGWTREQALHELGHYAEAGAEAVEQPTAPGSPSDLCWLAERSPLPVIADEDVESYEDALRLAGKVQGVNVKLAKCGGVRAALRISTALAGSGTHLMLGCLAGSTLSIAPAVHVVDRARWVDLDGHLLIDADPWTGIGGANGTVRVSGRPGLGISPAGCP
uniref:Mandelate racemase/muconate lactonizing enzyme family protein n=1 Tax=Streptomyces sp. FR1 TaxID=349971 RepID=V9Z5M0_9ACTN|nr:enolase C-terminal domain-like protein [Streptomyces sp. FR1]AHE38691.1 Mandelate racemase/muconate lactonizing enzyme family protein [Streptomyces sp. FR1]